jgi:hypothetical protein
VHRPLLQRILFGGTIGNAGGLQQGEVEGACGHAIQALLGVAQTRSQTVLQRLLTLRDALESWKATEAVRTLDEQMARLLTVSEVLAIA